MMRIQMGWWSVPLLTGILMLPMLSQSAELGVGQVPAVPPLAHALIVPGAVDAAADDPLAGPIGALGQPEPLAKLVLYSGGNAAKLPLGPVAGQARVIRAGLRGQGDGLDLVAMTPEVVHAVTTKLDKGDVEGAYGILSQLADGVDDSLLAAQVVEGARFRTIERSPGFDTDYTGLIDRMVAAGTYSDAARETAAVFTKGVDEELLAHKGEKAFSIQYEVDAERTVVLFILRVDREPLSINEQRALEGFFLRNNERYLSFRESDARLVVGSRNVILVVRASGSRR
ncbi:MAG: hypothetical protein KGO96_05115 [Elusimicrobia bacterium]|nr:hypothetical protein [Elusimicrobiota bacterium]MDE2425271.1 hypothetical protein [Elusimicrobiota bacterium]